MLIITLCVVQVFSGKVVSCSSEAVASLAGNPLYILARAVGLQRSAPAAAVHTLSVQASVHALRLRAFIGLISLMWEAMYGHFLDLWEAMQLTYRG